jgi:asparagine synthase (glutamine-hydrolysing)
VDEGSIASCIKKLGAAAGESIARLPTESIVLGYSGGIDSAILGKLLDKPTNDIKLLTLGRERSSDFKSVLGGAGISKLGDASLIPLEREEIEDAAKQVQKVVEVSTLSHFEDCVAFRLIASHSRELFPRVRYLLSANGPDELFCGYDRFRRILDTDGYHSVEREITRALNVAEDLSKQVKLVVSHFGFDIREPFLSDNFRDVGLKIPVQYKILPNNDLLRKRIWRCLGRSEGLFDKVVTRPKKAMQYGMGIHGIVHSMLMRGALGLDSAKEQR